MNTAIISNLAARSMGYRKVRPAISHSTDEYKAIKNGIWLYLLLLLFEGALRKWFLPGLATPLLVVRDPIAMYVVFASWSKGILPRNNYLSSMVAIGILGLCACMIFGHRNLAVAAYGARPFLFHFPMMFVIARVFTREDILKMGKAIVWISIPMTLLLIMQFYSPQSAWVNRGIGGNTDGAGFVGSGEYFRPPATFSFTNGTTLFYSLAGCFILYFWFNKSISRLVVIAATICLIIAIPLSISRGLFFQVAISLIFIILSISRKPQYIGKIIFASIFVLGGFVLLSKANFFNTGTAAFIDRFTTANEAEGGIEGVFLDRYFGALQAAVTGAPISTPLFGYGLGKGTNVGAMLLTGSTDVFLISEGEWGRIIGELGPLLGIMVILIRFSMSFKLGLASFGKLKNGDILPWMLSSYGVLSLIQDSWAQPTALGFFTIVVGLVMASLASSPKNGQRRRKQAILPNPFLPPNQKQNQ